MGSPPSKYTIAQPAAAPWSMTLQSWASVIVPSCSGLPQTKQWSQA